VHHYSSEIVAVTV